MSLDSWTNYSTQYLFQNVYSFLLERFGTEWGFAFFKHLHDIIYHSCCFLTLHGLKFCILSTHGWCSSFISLHSLSDLRAQIEVLKLSVEKEQESVVEKERECVRRVQTAREEEWTKIHTLETDKLVLQSTSLLIFLF